MITFHTIKYKNFLSTGNVFNEIRLDEYKTNLSAGTNGAGKSTFSEAISFVLYGKALRKINKPQLINNVNKNDLLVEITFSTNNNHYKIVRGMRPNVFEIYENDKLINQDADSRDYQNYLETNILKMNYKTFTQIVVIGNATHVPFMKLNPAERRFVVENLLDIDIFSKMNRLLKFKIDKNKDDIGNINYDINITKEKVKLHKSVIEDSRNNIQAKIDTNNSLIETYNEKIEYLKTELNKLQIMSNNIQSDIDLNITDLKEKIQKVSEYQITFKNKIKAFNKEIKFFEESTTCSTCSQEIPETYKDEILTKKKNDLQKFQNAIELANIEYEKLDEKLSNFMDKSREVNKCYETMSSHNAELSSIESLIQNLLTENKRLLEEKSEDMLAIEMEYDNLLEQNKILIQQRDSLLNSQHLNSIAAVLLKDDGIKTKIIRHYLPAMNKIINKYLQMMDSYVDFTLDENFEEVILNAAKEGFSYFSFSEGEKLRINLAILFTWREITKLKNSANTNLLILDEIFDSSLDAAGIDDFLKIINIISDNTNTFIISHKDEIIQDRFDNVIRFEKVNGFSRIVKS